MLTVATVSMFNCLIAVELQTNIWKATVRRVPPEPPVFELLASPATGVRLGLGRPSPEITNPDGRIGIIEVSSPLTAKFINGTSSGAYTIKDPEGSVQVS